MGWRYAVEEMAGAWFVSAACVCRLSMADGSCPGRGCEWDAALLRPEGWMSAVSDIVEDLRSERRALSASLLPKTLPKGVSRCRKL